MHRTLALAGALMSVFAATSAVEAQPRVEVGILSCAARTTTGTIFASSKSLYCRFQQPGRFELYRGRIDRYGLDLGSTDKTAIARSPSISRRYPTPGSASPVKLRGIKKPDPARIERAQCAAVVEIQPHFIANNGIPLIGQW